MRVGNSIKKGILEKFLPESKGLTHISAFNSLPWARPGKVVALSGKPDGVQQYTSHGEALVYGNIVLI